MQTHPNSKESKITELWGSKFRKHIQSSKTAFIIRNDKRSKINLLIFTLSQFNHYRCKLPMQCVLSPSCNYPFIIDIYLNLTRIFYWELKFQCCMIWDDCIYSSVKSTKILLKWKVFCINFLEGTTTIFFFNEVLCILLHSSKVP